MAAALMLWEMSFPDLVHREMSPEMFYPSRQSRLKPCMELERIRSDGYSQPYPGFFGQHVPGLSEQPVGISLVYQGTLLALIVKWFVLCTAIFMGFHRPILSSYSLALDRPSVQSLLSKSTRPRG